MNILGWIVVGLIAGLVARLLVPGDDPGGVFLTILIGIGGALVGGYLSVALGVGNGVDNFDIGTIVLAVLGSILVLFGYRLILGDRSVNI